MLQYQCVVPREGGIDVIRSIIRELQRGSASSFLAVVKTFGTARSPGLMSFPKPGITITLDMPNTGKGLLSALDRCDEIVSYVGGRVYAAKDARMSGTAFRMMYPAYETFASFVDPQVSSSFWRRIHAPHQ
jgi:FAD/FMN-containing dehydrogenase